MRLRSAIAAHPLAVAVLAAVAAAGAAFVLAYFEPHKVFIDDRVSEPLPIGAAAGTGDGEASAATPSGDPQRAGAERAERMVETVASGTFRSHEHATSGRARVLRLPDGSRFLRFERFETSNGPDVRVYLSAAPEDAPGDAFDDDYVELGELKGNIGDQNYRIPRRVDLDRLRTAVVWCERFSVAFGAATLR